MSNININEEKEQYEYNVNVCFTITDLLNTIERDNKTLSDKRERLNLSSRDLELKKIEYKEKEDKFNKLNDYSKYVEVITTDINNLSNQLLEFDRYLNKKESLDKVISEYKIYSSNYDVENKLFEEMRKKYYLNISVEIADNLKDGEECHVCGSVHHPKKAISVMSEYTKEDLEKQESKLKVVDGLRKK